MNKYFDVAIIGGGAMGSAAAFQLSHSNLRVLLFDKYAPPHSMGSSHGQSRIIREAYFESPMYVPLVRQAYSLWSELEKVSGRKLFIKTGGLMLGNKDDKVFEGSSTSASKYEIECELLSAETIKAQFPVFKPMTDTVALYEGKAGILFPEQCIEANLDLAIKQGVDCHFNETAVQINRVGESVEIKTDKATYTGGRVIICNGAWISALIPEIHLSLEVKRQVLFWFECKSEHSEKFLPIHFPIYIWEHQKNKIFYGFPDLGDGVKIAIHHQGQPASPDTLNRVVANEEIDEMREIIHRFFEGEFEYNYSQVCMYTNTPDEHFIIDFHPSNSNIIIASACSGHGFKFSSAIGKILSEMAMGKDPEFDISVFNVGRFKQGREML